MNVHGKITYKVNLSTKRLFFDLNIQSVDLIRYVLCNCICCVTETVWLGHY